MINKMLDITVHHYLIFTSPLKKKFRGHTCIQEIQHLVGEIKTWELPTFPP